jgi:hypothetical protein
MYRDLFEGQHAPNYKRVGTHIEIVLLFGDDVQLFLLEVYEVLFVEQRPDCVKHRLQDFKDDRAVTLAVAFRLVRVNTPLNQSLDQRLQVQFFVKHKSSDDRSDCCEALPLVFEQACEVCDQVAHFNKDPASFHVLGSLFNCLLVTLFDALPELLRQNVDSIQQLLLCLLIFAQLWELLVKFVVVFSEKMDLLLLGTAWVGQEVDEAVLSFV